MLVFAGYGDEYQNDYTWHSFRALKAVVMRESGAHPPEVTSETGHKSEKSLELYDEYSVEAKYRLQHLNFGIPMKPTGYALRSAAPTTTTSTTTTSSGTLPPRLPPAPPTSVRHSTTSEESKENEYDDDDVIDEKLDKVWAMGEQRRKKSRGNAGFSVFKFYGAVTLNNGM